MYCITKRGWWTGESAEFRELTSIEAVQADPPTLGAGQAAVWADGAWVVVTDQGQLALAKAGRSAALDLRALMARSTAAEWRAYVNADDDVMAVALGRGAMSPAAKAGLRALRRRIELTTSVDLLDAGVVAAIQGLVQLGLLSQLRADALLRPV
jgi:hypothetical protein